MGGSAVKYDGAKAPVVQGFLHYFPNAMMAVAWVSEYGSRKYAWRGWQDVENGIVRYTDADARHLLLEGIEGPYDDNDSGLAHAVQHAWNAMARVERMIVEKQIEVRRGNDIDKSSGKPLPVLGTARKV